MADRSTKAIGAIRVGDKVLAKDPATGKVSARTVTTLHANRGTDLTDVTLADRRGGSTVLHTTDHHPFWDRQRGGWVDAADLHPGSQVTGLDNRPVRVIAVTSHTGSKLMNDLTIANIHTYYVMAGDTPVLVHNCGNGAYEVPLGEDGLPTGGHTSGTGKAPGTGGEPNSVHTRTGQDGTPVQNTIYDADGNAVGHYDFKSHGTGGPHGHVLDPPGNLGSGHGPGAVHIPGGDLPPGWDLTP